MATLTDGILATPDDWVLALDENQSATLQNTGAYIVFLMISADKPHALPEGAFRLYPEIAHNILHVSTQTGEKLWARSENRPVLLSTTLL